MRNTKGISAARRKDIQAGGSDIHRETMTIREGRNGDRLRVLELICTARNDGYVTLCVCPNS